MNDVIGLIDKQAFEQAFLAWVELEFGTRTTELIHIDGKRIIGSVDRELQYKPPSQGGRHAEMIVNAYASDTNLVVAQVNVSQTWDEKQGAKQLIEQLHLKGKTITGDSNFCVKDLLKRIRKKQGHYLMALKGNQPILRHLAERYFGQVWIDRTTYYSEEKGHGRKEKRTYQSIDIRPSKDEKLKEYSGLCQIIKVQRIRTETRKNKSSEETHYYITSLDKKVEDLAVRK